MPTLSIVHLLSNRWWTGTAEPVLALVKGLLERRQHIVLGVPAGSQVEDLARKAGIPLLEGLQLERRFRPRSWLQDLRRLSAFLQHTPVNVLHTHLSHDHWLGLCALALLRGREPRTVVHVRTVHTLRRPHVLTSRWLLRHGADHLITVSVALRHELMAKLQIAAPRVTVVSGAVDHRRFHPSASGAHLRQEFGLGPQTPLVGIVARIAASRGHLMLLDAFARVHATLPEARLLIVGKGEFRPQVEQRVQQLGLADSVIFAGYREDDLPEVLAALHLFVLMAPGSEGSCRAVLEAMAVGKPVVAARVGALADIVLDGETGLLIDPHSPAELALAISRLLRAPEQARQMGLRGRQCIECSFARERQLEDVLSLYAQLCAAQLPASAILDH
jgi:glycosyltransferase involved in cell wall biosynthesis